MDINQQLQPIVASLIDNLKLSLEQEIRDNVSQQIVDKIASAELTDIINVIVKEQITQRIAKFNLEATTQSEINNLVTQIVEQISKGLTITANKQINDAISKQVAAMDIQAVIDNVAESKLSSLVNAGKFPPGSIPYTSLNFKGFAISGDHVKGGIIENFGSTGIEDRSTFVQLTLLDHATVFEGPVWTPEAVVKGNLTVDGDLLLKGTIPEDSQVFQSLVESTSNSVRATLNDELFRSFSDIIGNNIREHGLDLDRITQAGKEVVKGNQLGYHITDSNLQRVGFLKDLQTQGETLLCDTMYVSANRVGVNTMDPSAVFAVWDEEVELIVAKRKQDTGYIGTPRRQPLILGANNQDNLILNVDGSAQVENLVVGRIAMTSSRAVPNYEGQMGQIVWNEGPSPGGPIGWVCLGSTRWAKFGTID